MMWFLWFLATVIFVLFILILFLLNFYRDPEREIPEGSNIVAPADGKIISMLDTSKGRIKIRKEIIGKIDLFTKDVAKECYVISIFMSPLDVHINRSPISGIVKYTRHTKGKFFKAYDLEKSFENEKNEILIVNKGVKVKVIQIAGFLARRIMCHVTKNQKVNKGQKIGMIALGSQTSLVIPKSMRLKVKLNQKNIKAGETVIAD